MEVEWDVEETVDFITRRCFTSVALQFPDELLQHSTKVATLLTGRLGSFSHCKVYVLAVSKDVAVQKKFSPIHMRGHIRVYDTTADTHTHTHRQH